jgi:hypothetical protein
MTLLDEHHALSNQRDRKLGDDAHVASRFSEKGASVAVHHICYDDG